MGKLSPVPQLLFTVYLVFLTTGLDIFISYFDLIPIKPHVFFTPILLILILPYLGFWKEFIQSYYPVLIWSFLFLVLLVAQQLILGGQKLEFVRHVYFVIFLLLNLYLFNFENFRDRYLLVIRWSLVVVIGFLLIEFFIGLPFSLHQARSAFFFLNPNGAGEAIVLMYLVSLNDWKQRVVGNEILGALTSLALACTLSRSAILIFWILAIVLLFTRSLEAKKFLKYTLVSLSVFYGVLYLPAKIANFDWNAKVGSYSHLAGHRVQNDFSSQHRLQLALDGIKTIFKEQVIFGKGAGYAAVGEQRTHNLYIETWIQFGVFSILILGFLYYSQIVNARGPIEVAAPISVILFGVFDHNGIFQSKVMIMVMAFCIAYRGLRTKQYSGKASVS